MTGKINPVKHNFMISTHEFVEMCLSQYEDKLLEPGNPADGDWHKAHHPVPACKGGNKWTWLTKEHHAIHNVLQSEEFEYPCIWNWERNYLSGEYLELFLKWFNIKCSNAAKLAAQSSHKVPREARVRAGKVSAQKRRERGTLLAQCSKAGKIGGSKTSSQKWRCTITGFISNAGNLTQYQKARGIDPSNRERLN